MLVIRLARTGRAKYPTYRIVAAESARAATGKFVSVLGHYNPHTKELVLDKDEVKQRLAQGAQPSNTVIKLLMREKVELPAWVKLHTTAPKPKDEPAAEPTTAAPSTAETPDNADGAQETRIAEVNEDAATEAEDKATPIDHTDTATDEEAAAQ